MVHEGKGVGRFQAHLALETRCRFRLISHWIILEVDFGVLADYLDYNLLQLSELPEGELE